MNALDCANDKIGVCFKEFDRRARWRCRHQRQRAKSCGDQSVPLQKRIKAEDIGSTTVLCLVKNKHSNQRKVAE